MFHDHFKILFQKLSIVIYKFKIVQKTMEHILSVPDSKLIGNIIDQFYICMRPSFNLNVEMFLLEDNE